MRLNLSAAVLAGALSFPPAAFMAAQQAQVSTVVVSLQDTFGGGETIPFAQAHVRVYPPPERAPTATGDAGTFSFGARPGKYDLFVGANGFKTIAKRIEVQNVPAMVLNLSLWIESCPPGPCFVIEEHTDKALSVSPDEDDRPLNLKVDDLKSLRHQTIVVYNPATQSQESYSGVSVADLLRLGELTGEYVFVSGDDGYIAFPRAKLATGLNGSRIVAADGMDGGSFRDRLRAFVIENGQVTQSVRGIIWIRSAHAAMSVELVGANPFGPQINADAGAAHLRGAGRCIVISNREE
jgi:hypothetical protein